ncbi:MAG TPA: hypothetical protein VIW24_28370 [Aldersonia sp.]
MEVRFPWSRVALIGFAILLLGGIVTRAPILLLGAVGAAIFLMVSVIPNRPAPAVRTAPRPGELAQRWADAHTELGQLDAEWLNFVTDPEALFLQRPLLLDHGDAVVGAYHRAWAEAKEAAQDAVEPTAADLARFERLVATAWEAWHRANAHAVSVGLDNFRTGERVALRRARKIIALMDDPATTPAYRDELLDALRRALDQLESVAITPRVLRNLPALASLDLRELE